MAGFEKKKSPGPDNLKPVIFEHLDKQMIDYLSIMYKATIFLSYTPKLWKETWVIFIPKSGKTSYSTAKSFRPISLSNYFIKVLERLVSWRMDEALKTHPIHKKQHGFQTGKSTESALSNTVNYIESYVFKNQYALGVFLDISSAFDSIDPDHVKRCLIKHGGDEQMIEWYYQYLKHRDLIIRLHGTEKTVSNGMGFPQGGVCSAKFWLIAFNLSLIHI